MKSSQVHETFRLKKLKRVRSINKCKKAEMVMESSCVVVILEKVLVKACSVSVK